MGETEDYMVTYNPRRYLCVLYHVEVVKITWFSGEINASLFCVLSYVSECVNSCYYSSEKIKKKKLKKFPYVDNRNMEGNVININHIRV